MSNKLSMSHLLEAGLLDQVFIAYAFLKQQRQEDSSALKCGMLLALLMSQAIREAGRLITTDDDGKYRADAGWIPVAEETILSCSGA